MKKIILGVLLLVFSGCMRPKPPDKADWTGRIRILPVIVQNKDLETKWTQEQIDRSISDTNQFWATTGLQFVSLPTIYVVNQAIYDEQSVSDYLIVVALSNKLVHQYKAYPVFFVNTISWEEQKFGGLSSFANMPFGFQYGTTIAFFKVNSHGSAVAHELGHAWNLRHAWEDKFTDTICSNKRDCNKNIKCNVMSYCHPSTQCLSSPFFTAEQIKEIRLWAWSPSRSNCTDFSENRIVQTNYRLEEKFTPAID